MTLTLTLKIDYRLGGIPAYKLVEDTDNLMQIPDEIRKCVVFVCFKDSDDLHPCYSPLHSKVFSVLILTPF